jgi:FG-GAP repeat
MQRIALPPLEQRLQSRYLTLVHAHMHSAPKLAAGVASLPSTLINGSSGFSLVDPDLSTTYGYVGYSVAAGDINGDGKAEVITSAPWAAPGGLGTAGSTYVLYGRKTYSSSFTPFDLNGL